MKFKKWFSLISAAMLLIVTTNVIGQAHLEDSAEKLGVTVNLPSNVSASSNDHLIYPVEITEKDPLPTIAQQFGGKPAFGDTYFNVLFGKVNSVLTYKERDCEVIVYMPPGKGGSTYGRIVKDSAMLHVLKNLSFGRIKRTFGYGKRNKDASEFEAIELYSMLTHHPNKKAKEMFNADVFLEYPLNFRGNTYKNKYTRGRGVVVAKNRREIYLYFMMTEKSVLNYDGFLSDFEKVFWFNE